MLSYLGAVWQCRYFWMTLVKMDLRTRYRRSILGLGWSLLHPIALTIVICTMFSSILGTDPWEYGPYLLAGFAYWNFVLTSTTLGCQSLFMGESYIRQHPAPLLIYPLRTTLGSMIHFLIAMVVVIPTAYLIGPHGYANPWSLLTLLPTVILLFLLGWSLGVLAGFANVYFQDTQHLCEVGFQILFYATPIIYDRSGLENKNLGWVAQYNPLAAFLDLIRQPVLKGQMPDVETFGIASLTVAVLGVAASIVLAKLQRRLIFQL
jgi:lipopolysaccharide transport system permease protein